MALFNAGKIASLQQVVNDLTQTLDVGDGTLILNAMVQSGLPADQAAAFVIVSPLDKQLACQFLGGLAVNLSPKREALVAGVIVAMINSGEIATADAATAILAGAATYPQGILGGLHLLLVLAVAFGTDAAAQHVEIGSAIGAAIASHQLTEYFPQMQAATGSGGLGLTVAATVHLLCGAARSVDTNTQYTIGYQIAWIGLSWAIDSLAFVDDIDAVTGSGGVGFVSDAIALNLLLALGNTFGWPMELLTAVGTEIGKLVVNGPLTKTEALNGLGAAFANNLVDKPTLQGLIAVAGLS
jgi:hypothetical protein